MNDSVTDNLCSRNTLDALMGLCEQAGNAILAHYHGADRIEVESKSDRTPLTAADLASHRLLDEGLQGLWPDVPVLSEESPLAVTAQRREWDRFWLVDPLDGTREFLEETGQFTINIALVESHRPVLGLIYQPLEALAYAGIPGEGAWQIGACDGSWRELACRSLGGGFPTVLASARHRGPRLAHCLDWLNGAFGGHDRLNSGSAIKFCDMAAGRGDLYPRFSPCSEWDVAAGDALVSAAGGAVLDMAGVPLRYNCRDTLLSPDFIALADPTASQWRGLLGAMAT